jgi:predicted nucleic acid-binding protein
MLRHDDNLVRRMLRAIPQGDLAILDVRAEELAEIDALYARYSDLSPQLADLTLLHLARREILDTVFTLDRRDFGTFRLKGNKRLRLLPEEDD